MIRSWTPDVVLPRGGTRIAVKRACSEGHRVGDVTEAEMERAIAGLPPEDVRGECPRCLLPDWWAVVDLAFRRVDSNPGLRYRVSKVDGAWRAQRTTARRRQGVNRASQCPNCTSPWRYRRFAMPGADLEPATCKHGWHDQGDSDSAPYAREADRG